MRSCRFIAIVAGFAVALAVSGCASTEAYERMLDDWKGKHVDRLVDAWGPPNATHTFEDGRRTVQYTERTTRFIPPVSAGNPYLLGNGLAFPGQVRELVCVTSFDIGLDGIIRAWKWRGNACAVDNR